MNTQPHILICGASIAGPVLSLLLSQSGIKTTIIERAPSLRTTGQQVDIRGSGLTVVKHMGLEDITRSKTTDEEGIEFVTDKGRQIASFPVNKETGMSFTSDIEILRGELARIFYETSSEKKDTEYIFGDHVTEIEDSGKKVQVTLDSGKKLEFDLVVGADGMNSKTRRLAFPGTPDPLKSLGQYIAFFTIPYQDSDGTFARWYNASGGRSIFLRPDKIGCTRAYLAIMSSVPAGYENKSEEEQEKMFRELFSDAGWEVTRVLLLDGMDKTDDWYMQEIAQVKMPTWHQGRVALLGDAAYAPSPISGMGTSLAIMGAYILAGEIVTNGENYEQAFENYEEKMRGYVDKAQKLLPGAPAIANPQTRTGITILNGFLGFISSSGLATLFSKFTLSATEERDDLPQYEF